ncbi:hypothetical protein L6164_011216 [Bauhinia variegata]|uniref:Uncharacterized protein n=1 Tax=Bauhinia variegata TaxID=167791 RepID=A0ACB9P5X9_BAUVA|nr:hypothetical protein L6164_011216 [Bauhinia variegata]
MKLTEEQRKQIETNRLAAIAKRKALLESRAESHQQEHPWELVKCRKLSHDELNPRSIHLPKEPQIISARQVPPKPLPNKFRFLVRLEICSPDSFSATPLRLQGVPYPGEEPCLKRLSDSLSDVMPSHYTQNNAGRKASVYKLRDYHAVLKCLKASSEIEVEEITWGTFNVVERLSHSFVAERWIPCRPEHLSDDVVDELIENLPRVLLDALLPFQLDGLRFGLRRGGRCLIADEMGLGKTLQAIAIAGCFMNEGSILVVCPAVMRFTWAEELERWLPFCLPADIHLVFGHRDNPAYLTRCPRVVVISYTMLHHLRKSMLEREWAILIVDESHHVRCTKKASETGEIKAVLDAASKVKRIILLSGTPSLSRPFDIFHQINILWPGLLGKSKYDFAKLYCDFKVLRGIQGKYFQDFSKGIRLEELNVLLKQTVMIRRLKEHVLLQLPPKRRQIIRLSLKRSDIVAAKTAVGVLSNNTSESASEDATSENLDEPDGKLSLQELGIAKLSGLREWLSIHPLIAEPDSASKMIIFAHHHKVLDGIQEFICEKGISFVRIDGNTPAKDRQLAVGSFRSSPEVRIAIVGILAAGYGVDFSSAQNVVFLELPQCPNMMLQAEDRAHRRGQTNAVNVYIFSAKDTVDESHWRNLNKSLYRISTTTDGKYDAMKEIAVEGVSYLGTSVKTDVSYRDQSAAGTACTETSEQVIEFPDACSVLDLEPPQKNCRKSATESSGKSDIGFGNNSTQTSHVMTDTVSGLESGKVSDPDGNLDIDGSHTEEGGFYAHKMDKSGAEKDQVVDFVEEETHKGKEQMIEDKRPSKEAHDNLPLQPIAADNSSSDQIDALRFEVSPYTGRIHLYSCISGTDTRPRPLYENFRPEELELLGSLFDDDRNKVDFRSVNHNPACRHALVEFINEWKKLRPIERKKLQGKPLQLPLAVELSYLSESINHNNRGLLNGGSNRRTTPLVEISHPLPSDALWRKVYLRSGHGKKEKEYAQGWSLAEEPLCKLCQKPCMGNNAKTPEYFEDLFCNLGCYEEYRIRTSNRFLRQELFQIERGVCSNCQLDCHKLVEHIRPLSLEMRREYIEKVAPKVAKRKNMLEKLVNDPTEGDAWHADHIIPVYDGGGECRLENMRTLCVACHYDVTAAQCAERRRKRAEAKKLLKNIMSNLKNGQMVDATDSRIKDHGLLEAQRNVLEDELIIKVPGSAYSENQS